MRKMERAGGQSVPGATLDQVREAWREEQAGESAEECPGPREQRQGGLRLEEQGRERRQGQRGGAP